MRGYEDLRGGEHSPYPRPRISCGGYHPHPRPRGEFFLDRRAPNGAIPAGIPELQGELPCLLITWHITRWFIIGLLTFKRWRFFLMCLYISLSSFSQKHKKKNNFHFFSKFLLFLFFL